MTPPRFPYRTGLGVGPDRPEVPDLPPPPSWFLGCGVLMAIGAVLTLLLGVLGVGARVLVTDDFRCALVPCVVVLPEQEEE